MGFLGLCEVLEVLFVGEEQELELGQGFRKAFLSLLLKLFLKLCWFRLFFLFLYMILIFLFNLDFHLSLTLKVSILPFPIRLLNRHINLLSFPAPSLNRTQPRLLDNLLINKLYLINNLSLLRVLDWQVDIPIHEVLEMDSFPLCELFLFLFFFLLHFFYGLR